MTVTLTAAEAAQRLGVSRQKLYAYVSRGLLRALGASDPRQRRYDAGAIAALAAARRVGRRPKEAAKAALDWGLPVLESSITLIRDGHLYYRGQDAIALAQSATVEAVACLLWRMDQKDAFPDEPPAFVPAGPDAQISDDALLANFAAATDDDATAAWRDNPRVLASGCGGLVRLLLYSVTGGPPASAPLHRQLAVAWRLHDDGADLVRMALVLCADHELNASSFAARVIASTGASSRACVVGGLAALSGGLHGGTTTRIESLWNGLGPGDLAAQLRRRLTAGESLPGFGHPLYPAGDPRATALLARIERFFPIAGALAGAACNLTGRAPNIDFALVALRRGLGLPEGAAFNLFALGRSLGWIAHALEQRETGQLIRPRAVYRGPEPVTGAP